MQPWRIALACVGLLAVGASSVQAQAISTDFVPTARVEKLSEPLETLARDYRIEIYETFRTDRAEYNRRREALETLTTEWREAGEPASQSSQFAAWLRTARENSQPGSVHPLPPMLTFNSDPFAPKAQTSATTLTSQTPAHPHSTHVAPPAHALPPKQVATQPLSQRPRSSRLRGFRAFARALTPDKGTDSDHKQPAADPSASNVDLPSRATPAAPPAPITNEAQPKSPHHATPAGSTDVHARVSDHNRTLAQLENQLLEREMFTGGMLSEQLATLKELSAQNRQLQHELEQLQHEQRQGVEPLRSHAEAHELLHARIDQARRHVAEDDFLATDEARELELKILATLHDKLDTLKHEL